MRRAGFRVRAWRAGQQPWGTLLNLYRQPAEEPDLVLGVGGDLHIPEIHQTPEARKIWKSLSCPRVCLSYESLRESLWPESRAKFTSSLEVFTHYAVCDEMDESWVVSQGRPARWIPQGVDVDCFRPGSRKRREIVFRGKFQEYEQYAPRRKLLGALIGAGLIRIHSRELSISRYRRLYQRSAGILNPRGVFGGYNVRTFEALASGCVLFQQEIPQRPRNAALLRPGLDAVLLPEDEQACVQILADTDWEAFALRRMALQGPHLARARHSLEDRWAQILEWIGNDLARPELLAGARHLRERLESRVVQEGNPPQLGLGWKKIRRTLYRFCPSILKLSHRKKLLGMATANGEFIRNPSRLQQDRFVHRKFLHGRRQGTFQQVGSRLPAGSPVLYLKKFWGWCETDAEKAEVICLRGPGAPSSGNAGDASLLIVDNFSSQAWKDASASKFRTVYAESDQEYMVPRG